MKKLRFLMVACLAGGALALVGYWSRKPAGFAAPRECVQTCWEAGHAGDAAGYLRCLAEPLRSKVREAFPNLAALSEELRRSKEGVKSWVLVTRPTADARTAHIDVDEVLAGGTRRYGVELEQTEGSWLIRAITPPKELKTLIPYGTHVSETGQ